MAARLVYVIEGVRMLHIHVMACELSACHSLLAQQWEMQYGRIPPLDRHEDIFICHSCVTPRFNASFLPHSRVVLVCRFRKGFAKNQQRDCCSCNR